MSSLNEVFSDPNSRVMRTILVVDINDSTRMKEEETEATWLTTYGHFFSRVSSVVEEEGGAVIKYLGDGALAVFQEDAENAINAAIQIQEQISRDNENARIKLNCSVGVSSGEVIEFSVAGRPDYIGATVDRAFRLCSAANARAIFVDLATESDARMSRVHSKVGLASSPRWKAQDYLGEKYRMSLKGFSKPVGYFEIQWCAEKYGVSSGYVTTQSSEQSSRGRAPRGPRSQTERPTPSGDAATEWVPGRVAVWPGTDDGFGFVEVSDGERFYFNRSYLFFEDSEVEVGADVQFVPLEALPNTQNRRASKVLFLGDEARVKIDRIVPGKGFGFGMLEGQADIAQNLFILLGTMHDFSEGDSVLLEIGENDRGPIGENGRRP